MEGLDFINEKYGDNSWNYYPPAKETVAEWLSEYRGNAIKKIAQMVCDPENQPHQFTGDIEGFTEMANAL